MEPLTRDKFKKLVRREARIKIVVFCVVTWVLTFFLGYFYAKESGSNQQGLYVGLAAAVVYFILCFPTYFRYIEMREHELGLDKIDPHDLGV